MTRHRLRLLPLAALMLARSAFAAHHEQLLDQGWQMYERHAFWYTTQGSQMLPYKWFLHLEQVDPNNTDPNTPDPPFRSDAHLRGLGFIPWRAIDGLNPDALPIGFAKDLDNGQLDRGSKGKQWLGLTCAACHTSLIRHGRKTYLIEGAPTLADLQTFFERLHAALWRTYHDKKRFRRFALNVVGTDHGPAADELEDELLAEARALQDRERASEPPHPPGHGRIDAFGRIFNQVVTAGLDDPYNGSPANAPVSYPFLWGSHQSDVVQWNGAAYNRRRLGSVEVGPLARNVGQVLGVFGRFEITPLSWWQFWRHRARWQGYESSVRVTELGYLERLVKGLRAPMWPDALGRPDPVLVGRGKLVYENHCASCHQVIPRELDHQLYQARLLPVGTDPTMAVNFRTRSANTHALEGTKAMIFSGDEFRKCASSYGIVANAVGGVLIRNAKDALLASTDAPGLLDRIDAQGPIRAALRDLRVGAAETPVRRCGDPPEDPAYKARPLNGIWATAPYLHNGSVASLRQLLEPARDRLASFCVGGYRFDPVNVGVDQSGCSGSVLDTTLPGNSSQGHEFGTPLGASEKAALIEYLKTL